jgi:Fe-S cluster assembly iron-binding protein IscA
MCVVGTNDRTVNSSYEDEKIQFVVDSKSLLHLYGLELDDSNELVGGGFRFKIPMPTNRVDAGVRLPRRY